MHETATINEPSRRLPVAGDFDVVVVGGGMAGVAAAVAAARNGADVCLIERYCAVGGLATLGTVTIWLPLCDGRGHQVVAGLGEELLKLSAADLPRDYPRARFVRVPECWRPGGDPSERVKHRYKASFNPASYMLALEAFLLEAGVELLYDTRFCDVRRERSAISHVIVENKDGRSALGCKTVVDASGDADVCFAAGEETVSLDSNVLCGWFYTLSGGELTLHQLSNRYCPRAGKGDAEGPFFRGDRARHVTDHLVRTRAKVREKLAEFRAATPGEDVQPVMPATMACFRMTRRLAGRFTLEEAHAHRWFDDAIGLTGDWRKAGPVYAIPFRCLAGVRTSNLLAAGRCISVGNSAWDVLRAIPGCVVTGQAAGAAAALAAFGEEGDVHALDPRVLREHLQRQGVLLDPALVQRRSAGS